MVYTEQIIFIYIYIYIYIYFLTYYLPAFTVTRKKKKSRQNLEITKSRITAWGKKKKKFFGEKNKEKANFVTLIEKKSRDMQSVGQMNKNPTVKWCNATITNSAQYKSRANYRY